MGKADLRSQIPESIHNFSELRHLSLFQRRREDLTHHVSLRTNVLTPTAFASKESVFADPSIMKRRKFVVSNKDT